MKTVLPGLKLGKRRTADGYRVYNDVVQDLRRQLGLRPQALDVVLTLASQEPGTTTKGGFEKLFEEFVGSFVDSEEGQEHLRRYAPQRKEALHHFPKYTSVRRMAESVEAVGFSRYFLQSA
ncbi:MAG: hypothetical protein JW720_12240, partial [Sedimentisphaerales bacterium]|nr:hypothetical protein [Sedimentisphaerales bacterium]